MNKQNSFTKSVFPFLLMMVIIGISCKKYIYQAPITSTYGSEFWTSQTSVEQASLAMYGQLRADLRQDRSFFVFGDLTSGVFSAPYPGWWNYSTISANNPYGVRSFNFSYVPYLQGSLQNWSRFYQLIAQTNLILQNVPKMSPSLFESKDVQNSYIGEALFMRAYCYFYMIRVWGDPVYVTKLYNDVDYGKIPPVARTAESIVLDSCILDLKTAAGYLNYVGGDPSKVLRANKGTVYSLLAHIYAWRHDYANTHLACQEVINNGGYSLEPMPSYTNIWKGQSSSENIWELSMKFDPNDPNFSNQNSWAEAQFDFFGNTFLKGPIVDNVGLNDSWVIPAGGFVDQNYDTTNDARFHQTLSLVNASGSAGQGYLLTKYSNFLYQTPGIVAHTGINPYINNNLVLFRLSDIFLLDAEALASTGDLVGAKNELAKTEGRAGISSYNNPTTVNDMVKEVLIERGRELIGEGQWFYDLIRTNDTQHFLEGAGYQADRVTDANKGYYWPLDMATLFPEDYLLTQNPYWAVNK